MNFFENYRIIKISSLCALGSCIAFCIWAETSIKSFSIIGSFLLIASLSAFMTAPWDDDFS